MTTDSTTDNGCLLLVVGASGVGKDSILRNLQALFASHDRVHFLKRVITRPSDPKNEVHDSLSEEDFLVALNRGEFAVHWQANGNLYGLPNQALDLIKKGKVVVANGSRGAYADIKAAFPRVELVLITAKADTVKSRMEARGRDTADEIMQRLQRSAEMDKSMPTTLVIENDGSLQQAVKKLENYMNRLLSENPLS
jgi:ribose 1,5-bisphosphokinase